MLWLQCKCILSSILFDRRMVATTVETDKVAMCINAAACELQLLPAYDPQMHYCFVVDFGIYLECMVFVCKGCQQHQGVPSNADCFWVLLHCCCQSLNVWTPSAAIKRVRTSCSRPNKNGVFIVVCQRCACMQQQSKLQAYMTKEKNALQSKTLCKALHLLQAVSE